ncbi:toxin-antitoxin system YwqK family antitoxin [Janthinobacterium lividum]|uniref:toxin-antitoxin system YwqK family antitoxin n=1 Tax=Janthinobacterium lividum TaxID=29581 RepID=UPI000874FB09|nr:toxin-antitoxin system YwqK family antitoxin [Janthinobacterium lividum]MCC7713241.1 toxin-antitoxin system YwqK family antitoxin [Janthinobacterium lividum]OEZ51333.1 MORN repeat variant [Janthinobacterium lividum]WQE26311.1 toxin-antitoxin system YwqK family antitoxin [Janthinobacterium lividum]STQ97202.1 MORN repeat variant [Janthinobacterium lividum]
MARTVKHLFGAMLLLPALAHAEIVQRQVITAITAAPGSGDILTVDEDTGCGGRQLRMDAASVGLNEEQYGVMKAELANMIRDKNPLLVRLRACPAPGRTGAKAEAEAIPLIHMLRGCDAHCADGKARLYLNHNLSRGEVMEQARYALLLPLPPGKTPGTWQVEIYHVREGEPKRLIGQVNDTDYLRGKLVGNYSMYYPHGQLEMQVEQDGRGVQEGVQVRYYPDGQLSMRTTWRNGVQEGEEQAYHQNGKLIESRTYRNGARADGVVETFDKDGKLRTRTTQVKGRTDGELLLFYPDGKVESRSRHDNGIMTGPSTRYFPDGKVQRTANYVDGKPVGESVEYYPDGKVAIKRTHSGHFVLRSTQRFSRTGVLIVHKLWNEGGREEGALRSWYANGKPRQLIEYVDGERQGWTRHWREDGSVESECRYVADEPQGACTGASAKMSYTEDGIEFEMPEA